MQQSVKTFSLHSDRENSLIRFVFRIIELTYATSSFSYYFFISFCLVFGKSAGAKELLSGVTVFFPCEVCVSRSPFTIVEVVC